jgi:purine-binding chemotaxis protein CheW
MNNLSVQHTTAADKALIVQEQQGQYLTFQVANEGLGINIHEVKEIIEISNITRVPMTPDYIRGVINLRGNVVPVVDLSSRLSHEKSVITKRSCIVLVEISADGETQSIGMLVDQVNEILEIPKENIQPAPEFGADIRVEFIQAMGRVGDEFIILLEISRVLSVSELSQLSKSMTKGVSASQEADSY